MGFVDERRKGKSNQIDKKNIKKGTKEEWKKKEIHSIGTWGFIILVLVVLCPPLYT